jgi:hypothetical protein
MNFFTNKLQRSYLFEKSPIVFLIHVFSLEFFVNLKTWTYWEAFPLKNKKLFQIKRFETWESSHEKQKSFGTKNFFLKTFDFYWVLLKINVSVKMKSFLSEKTYFNVCLISFYLKRIFSSTNYFSYLINVYILSIRLFKLQFNIDCFQKYKKYFL